MKKRLPFPPLAMDEWVGLMESGKENVVLRCCLAWLQEGKQNGGLTRNSLQLFQHDIEQVLYTALQDSGQVTTVSEGSSPNRYVVIVPKITAPSKSGPRKKMHTFVYRSEKKRRR